MTCVKYHFDKSMERSTPRDDIPLVVFFDNMFDIARKEVRSGEEKVYVHNFANNERPGLYERDREKHIYFRSNTQEEQLLRATLIDNQLCVDEKLYPICEGKDSSLISTCVIFMNDPITGEKDRKNMYPLSVITCPLMCHPDNDRVDYTNPHQAAETYRRMLLVLNLAPPDSVFVTGLWGCGAFEHPVPALLKLWKKAMYHAKSLPKRIDFVIYLDVYTRHLKSAELKAILTD